MELKRLKSKIIDLQLKLEDIKGLDKSIFLQDPSIFHSLIEIVDEIKAVVDNISEDGLLDELKDILLVRDIKKAYLKLYNSLWQLFNEVQFQLKERKDIPWGDIKCIETYINNDHAAGRTDLDKKYLEETNTVSLDARKNTCSAIDNISQVEMNELVNGKTMLDKIQFDEDVFKQKIETGVRQYANKKGKKTYEMLRREAEKFKSETFTLLTPMVWGKVAKNEVNALTLAVEGKLTSFIDKEGLYEGFSPDQCKLMEENGELMQKIHSVGRAEDLFSFEYDEDDKDYYFPLLNAENIDLFYYLILRHNIIWRETFIELKPKFEDWLKGISDEDVINKLTPIFYNDREKATEFLDKIKRAQKDTEKTALVERLVNERVISDKSYKRDLWTILKESGLYIASESNWNQQINPKKK